MADCSPTRLINLVFNTSYGCRYKEFVDRIIAESLKVTRDSFIGAVYGMMEDGCLLRVDQITQPVRLISGEHDEIFPVEEHARVLASRLTKSSAISVHVVSDAGHSPNWDRPEEVTKLLEQLWGSGA